MDAIELDDEGLSILMAYLDVATTRSGKIIIDDMRAAYFDGDHPGIIEELAEIPHPYRPYVEMGLRMAFKKFVGAATLAEQIRAGLVIVNNPTEETHEH